MSDIIKKVIDTTTVGDGNQPGQGGLTYEQSDRFIDYFWDATTLGAWVFKKKMNSVEEEWSTISVGSRIIRAATEAVDTGENVGPAFNRLSLTAKKIRVDWELSSESLEDNIEGDQLEDHIVKLLTSQTANDLEDLAINGDTTSSDPALRIYDGWRKRAVNGGAHVVDHGGAVLNRSAFNKALKAVPRKYMKSAGDWKFFVGSGAIQDWYFSFQTVENGFISPEATAAARLEQPVRTEGPAGMTAGVVFGKSIVEVPLFNEERDGDYDTNSGTSGIQLPSGNVNHTDLWLTYPKNLVWGIKREVEVYRVFVPKKDTIEYTVYTRQGVVIENLDAFVVVKNVRVSD